MPRNTALWLQLTVRGIRLVVLSFTIILFYFFWGRDDLKDAATPWAIQLTSHVGRPPMEKFVAKRMAVWRGGGVSFGMGSRGMLRLVALGQRAVCPWGNSLITQLELAFIGYIWYTGFSRVVLDVGGGGGWSDSVSEGVVWHWNWISLQNVSWNCFDFSFYIFQTVLVVVLAFSGISIPFDQKRGMLTSFKYM